MVEIRIILAMIIMTNRMQDYKSWFSAFDVFSRGNSDLNCLFSCDKENIPIEKSIFGDFRITEAPNTEEIAKNSNIPSAKWVH